MSVTNCMFSGKPLISPVLSTKSGMVFEQSIVFPYIQEHGICPVSNTETTLNDFIPLQPNYQHLKKADVDKVTAGLNSIEDLWGEAAIENFTIKMQNEELQKELGFTLNQYEAALRTISRLLLEKERLEQTLKEMNKRGKD